MEENNPQAQKPVGYLLSLGKFLVRQEKLHSKLSFCVEVLYVLLEI
jgi:hypothetical protein